jgi:hypothetical protein
MAPRSAVECVATKQTWLPATGYPTDRRFPAPAVVEPDQFPVLRVVDGEPHQAAKRRAGPRTLAGAMRNSVC